MAKTEPKYDAGEIQAWVTKRMAEPWHTNLCTRMTDEFEKYYCLEQKPISESVGAYDQVVDNASRVYADKLIEELATGKLLFTIPMTPTETKSKESGISMTEQAVYGLLNMVDDALTSVPYGSPSQSQMAFYTTTTGFIIQRFWMYEENEHGEKVVVPDLALWHFGNTFWTLGKRGVSRICHVRYASADEVNDTYGLDMVDTTDKGIQIYDHWDEEWEQVVINGEVVNNDGKGMYHGLGYVPVRVITSGAMPVITLPDSVGSIDASQLMKYMAPSCWARGGAMWEASGELMSYYKTMVGRAARRPMKLPFDSSKGGEPIEYDKDQIDKKGANIPVDIGKGQDVEPIYTPEMSRDAQTLYSIFKQKADMASAPEIVYGVLNQDVTAQGTAMLIHAAMSSFKQGKRAMEAAYGWLANEMVKQYKNGKWKDIQVQGVDHSENQFATTIKRDNLVTDRRIEARLDITSPETEMGNIGEAIELKKSGLLSDDTIRDKKLKVADPEGEATKILMQRIEELTGISIRKAQKELLDRGDKLGAMELQKLLLQVQSQIIQQLMAAQAPEEPGGNGAGVPGAPIAGAMPGERMKGAMPSNRMNQARRSMQGRQ